MIVFRQFACNRAKGLYSGRLLYLGKNGCYRTKVVVFEIKVVIFGQSGCIR